MDGPRIQPLRSPPIAFAHRGASAHAPENTIAAFELALRLGSSGLESDVWRTADGAVVLDHDGRVRRGLRRVPISSLDRADLPAHIPMLENLYETCGAAFELSLDIKDPAAFEGVVATARAAGGGAESRLWLCHPEWEVLARWHDRTVAKLVDSTRLRRMKEGPERRAATLAEVGIDAVNLHHSDWTGGMTTLFHRFGRYALGWDAQHAPVIEGLVHMGIDGVFGDHVDRLVEVIRPSLPPREP